MFIRTQSILERTEFYTNNTGRSCLSHTSAHLNFSVVIKKKKTNKQTIYEIRLDFTLIIISDWNISQMK